MIIDEFVIIKGNKVLVKDLPLKSNVLLNYKCDNCGKVGKRKAESLFKSKYDSCCMECRGKLRTRLAIDNIKDRLNRSVINQVNLDKNRIDYVFEKIGNYLKLYTIKDKITQIDKIYDKINFEIENTISIESERLKNTGIILHNLSPLATLDRGYSIVHKEGEIINSIKQIKLKEELDIKLRDGNIKCNVESIEDEEV